MLSFMIVGFGWINTEFSRPPGRAGSARQLKQLLTTKHTKYTKGGHGFATGRNLEPARIDPCREIHVAMLDSPAVSYISRFPQSHRSRLRIQIAGFEALLSLNSSRDRCDYPAVPNIEPKSL
jgi:hypothetical protein